MLLLPLASARPAAGLVQEPGLSRTTRAVLREFGLELAAGKSIRVWDSNADIRYMVLPERPSGTEGMSEEQLAALVTRDGMIGTALV